MIRRGIYLLLSLILLAISSTIAYGITDEECDKGSKDSGCIDYFNNKLKDLGSQKKTLSSQIAQFNSQIQLTQLKIADAEATINKLEKEIGALGARIGYVNQSVDKLETLLKKRILATYEQGFVSNLEIIVTSRDFSDLILRLQYLKQVQESDKKMLTGLQQTKANYANQKDEREAKQAQIEASKKQLEALKVNLDQQIAAKQTLLKLTQNSEQKYQQLLAAALAEKKAINAVFSEAISRLNNGEGSDISEGGTVALLGNSGAPTCSTGAHLHFMVTKDGITQDPASYLKDVSPGWDNPDPKPSFSGSWNWPISNPSVTQIYGKSYYVVHYGWYGGSIHDGMDMVGDTAIHAPRAGKYIIGSTSCGGNALRYAAIKHNDDPGIITLYLHIQ